MRFYTDKGTGNNIVAVAHRCIFNYAERTDFVIFTDDDKKRAVENKLGLYFNVEVDKIIEEIEIKDFERINETTVRFKNDIAVDSLIKKLAKYNIDNLLIEEATLEELFFHYYSM